MISSEWRRLPPKLQSRLGEYQKVVPVPLAKLANEIGLKVLAATLPAGVSGELRPSQGEFVVKVNRHDSKARQRFTVAHEIAHFLLHRDHIGEGIRDDALYRSMLSDAREAEANRLAADLLMPIAVLKAANEKALRDGESDVTGRLAKEFGVSEAAMKIRLEQLRGLA